MFRSGDEILEDVIGPVFTWAGESPISYERFNKWLHDSGYISIITDNQVTQEAAARRHPALYPDASQKGEGVVPKRSLLTDLKLEVVGWRDAFSKRYIKRTHVACGIAFFQQFLGINALIY